MKWKLKESKKVFEANIFSLEQLDFIDTSNHKPLPHPFYRINSPDWVNVLPITTENEVILVRQPRAGVVRPTLEIPGGLVDPGEEPIVAAKRELEEETGYAGGTFTHLGSIPPNPAIQNNILHMFVATGVTVEANRNHFPDTTESIDLVTVSLNELEQLVAKCEINSALASLTIMLALKKPI